MDGPGVVLQGWCTWYLPKYKSEIDYSDFIWSGWHRQTIEFIGNSFSQMPVKFDRPTSNVLSSSKCWLLHGNFSHRNLWMIRQISNKHSTHLNINQKLIILILYEAVDIVKLLNLSGTPFLRCPSSLTVQPVMFWVRQNVDFCMETFLIGIFEWFVKSRINIPLT